MQIFPILRAVGIAPKRLAEKALAFCASDALP
jgi:hypothetical protein